MNNNCPIYGAHYYILDSKSYGKCACEAEKDFQIKETSKTTWPATMSWFKDGFYKRGKLDKSVRIG